MLFQKYNVSIDILSIEQKSSLKDMATPEYVHHVEMESFQ